MKPIATVLIPTHNHGETLLYAIASAQAQTIKEIEIFIIGDGVPEISRKIIHEIMQQDPRVKFFDHEKGPRHGEIYRHAALEEAQGEIVCYLSDDDLWLPHHVETLYKLLQQTNFANVLPITLEHPDRALSFYCVNLTMPYFRNLLLSGTNRVPLSCAGHTLDFYRQLPYGWRTTPTKMPTDLYMWQQFLSHPNCRAGSGSLPSGLHFPSLTRSDQTMEQRIAELQWWSNQIKQSEFYANLFAQILSAVLNHSTHWENLYHMKLNNPARTTPHKISFNMS